VISARVVARVLTLSTANVAAIATAVTMALNAASRTPRRAPRLRN
jgi:hypothetical protein